MKLNLGLLVLVGPMGLMACGANRTSRDSGAEAGLPTPEAGIEAGLVPMVEGGKCLVEGQQSDCAKDGYPAACGPCQGHWLLCQSGKWIPIHCEYVPPPIDASLDAPTDGRDTAHAPADPDSAMDIAPGDTRDSYVSETGGSTSTPVIGGSCSLEGQQSDCAKGGYPSACALCQGHWLLCQRGKWISVHCDPPMPVDPRPDAALDAPDKADVASIVDTRPTDVGALEVTNNPND